MSLAWRLKRLRSMDFHEVRYRTGQFARITAERLGLGRARPGEPGGTVSRPWLTSLPTGFEPAAYVAAAESIMQGRYTIFAMQDVKLGFPPDWNRDPKSGTRAPLTFGKSLNYRDERLVGNIKYLWEPNRHLELVTLAQAWHLCRDLRFAAACRTMLDSWFERCPYPLGPNWTSSLELGIRLVNWSFGWHLLGGEDSPLFENKDGLLFRRRWLDSIYQHCHFIAGHPSKYSSANNHLLGEQLGLFVAATTWPMWPESGRWQEKSCQIFEREALLQNSEDGVNREQATWYHHEVIDMMLIAGLVGRENGVNLSQAYWTRLERMLEFLASIMDFGGNVPAFGDSDDAVMVRFDPRRDFDAYRSLLCAGATLFRRSEFKTKARAFDDKARWLFGDAAAPDFESLPAVHDSLPVRLAFSEGGYYVLGGDFETEREVRIVVDAGPLGYLSIAAHGHADALSFTLSAGGRELLIDPGTFAYHTDRRWRDYFRGTAAHNTLRVDGEDQSVAGGSFMWTRHAQTTCHQFRADPGRQQLIASHSGYNRLQCPTLHRRRFTYEQVTRTLKVDDDVISDGAHLVELHWHFSEDCQVRLDDDRVSVTNGPIVMTLLWQAGLAARIARGDSHPPCGWVSPGFDEKRPSQVLVLSANVYGRWHGRTELRVLELDHGQTL